jgi:hypothetical protein
MYVCMYVWVWVCVSMQTFQYVIPNRRVTRTFTKYVLIINTTVINYLNNIFQHVKLLGHTTASIKLIKDILPKCGRFSVPNRNEYQEYFLG